MIRSILLGMAALIFTSTLVESGPTNLDCRRFVFAPICRGATIKRSQLPAVLLPSYGDDESDQSSENAASVDIGDIVKEETPVWDYKIHAITDNRAAKQPTLGQRRRHVAGRRWEN